MSHKSALVVDDSKSARVILSRMLEKYDIEVNMAESAEQAIEYLKNNRPDAIFMDHLMPGMDGLQAVQAIKGNPKTAMIPIMMYTSQEGELYVGQARALGAMGVLPKQVRPVDVSKVLYELHLLPDRRDITEPALLPVELENGTAVERPQMPAGNSGIDWGRRVETAVKEQASDIRRFMVASFDSFATRIVGDVRDLMPVQTGEPLVPPLPPERPVWPWVVAILAPAVIGAALAASWFAARNELARVQAEVAALKSANADLQHSQIDLATSVKDLTAALAAANSRANSAAPTGASTSNIPPRVEQVPYGEIPFDRSRAEALREMLTKLEAQGFRGVVKVVNHAGLFCLVGNAADGFAPAGSTLVVGKCDVIGNPFDEALTSQQRQSLTFANLVAGVRQRTAGAIAVALENAGSSHAATPYPARTESLTAGEWNRAAAANNRVEFSAEPAGPN
jgi:CheY-like chemotaxis protein